MKLKSSKYLFGLLIIFFCSSVLSEEKIDIWKNKKKQGEKSESFVESDEQETNKIPLNPANKIKPDQVIKIEDKIKEDTNENKVFGVYDPADYNFNLNMWSSTKAEDIRASLKRLKKIKLSKTSNEILESILLSYSFPPNGMKDDEFVASLCGICCFCWDWDDNSTGMCWNLHKRKCSKGKSSKSVPRSAAFCRCWDHLRYNYYFNPRSLNLVTFTTRTLRTENTEK